MNKSRSGAGFVVAVFFSPESDGSVPAAGVHADRVDNLPSADVDDRPPRPGCAGRTQTSPARILLLRQHSSQQQRRRSHQHSEYVGLHRQFFIRRFTVPARLHPQTLTCRLSRSPLTGLRTSRLQIIFDQRHHHRRQQA